MAKLMKMIKKAMVISMEDQVTYCNRTAVSYTHLTLPTTPYV